MELYPCMLDLDIFPALLLNTIFNECQLLATKLISILQHTVL